MSKVYIAAPNARWCCQWAQRHMPYNKKSDIIYLHSGEQLRSIDNPTIIFLDDWEEAHRDPDKLLDIAKSRMKGMI